MHWQANFFSPCEAEGLQRLSTEVDADGPSQGEWAAVALVLSGRLEGGHVQGTFFEFRCAAHVAVGRKCFDYGLQVLVSSG